LLTNVNFMLLTYWKKEEWWLILHTFAKIYSVVFLIITIFYKKIYLTKKQTIVFWGLFILSLSIMAYNMQPPNGMWDIRWHGIYMDQIRKSGLSFFNFILKNENRIGGEEYVSLFAFNILRYIVINISENNYLLSAICVFIDYSILSYIIIDWSYNSNSDYKPNLFTMLLSFTFMPYATAASGMRNALSSSFVGLAVYLYLYKKKSVWLFAILIFIAVTIHPVAIITVPFVFLAKMDMGALGFVGVFAVSALASPAARWMEQSNIPVISLIGWKYIVYTSDTQYRAAKAPLYGVLFITAIFLIIYFLFYRRFNMIDSISSKKTIYNFLAIYILYIWGNVGNYDMVLRPSYVLGTLAPILASFLSDKKIWSHNGMSAKKEHFVSIGATTVSIIVCCYVNYGFFERYGLYF